MPGESDPVLDRIVRLIVAEAQPEKIVLFGSRARGDATGTSDYDLLVVVQAVDNERSCSRRLYRALLDARIPAAVDIVVVPAHKLGRRQRRIHDVTRWAVDEGKVVHGA